MNVYDATIKYLPHVNTSGILSVQREYEPVLFLRRFLCICRVGSAKLLRQKFV